VGHLTTNGVTIRRAVAVALFVVVLATCAGCGSTKTVTKTVTNTVTAEAIGKSGVGAPAEQVQFGYIRSLKRNGGQYRLRFDPACSSAE
jgi:hypothetical protein